jgi:tetratricopeptide (TPR) repeat protein
MSGDDWFRHSDWSPEIEAAFFAKLARARDKAQYLRIQAGTLAQSHPRVTLDLLRRYFELGEDFDIAQAWCDKAAAQIALGDIAGAIESYEAGLKREETYPNLQTHAFLLLPLLIVRKNLRARYAQAQELLEKHRNRVLFPVDVFHWNGVLAIVLDESGQREDAADAANAALKAADATRSGFSRHPNVGLVRSTDFDLLKRIKKIAWH